MQLRMLQHCILTDRLAATKVSNTQADRVLAKLEPVPISAQQQLTPINCAAEHDRRNFGTRICQ